jgi:outer membrane protein OmpA-like peptidoglycan-associated protein
MKKFKKKLSFFRVACIVISLSLSVGCASRMAQNPTGGTITDVITSLKNGEIRLNCGAMCSGKWGANRRELKMLHDNESWRNLAIEVAKIGFSSDLGYYFLGRASEGLNFSESAKVYYNLASVNYYKCDGLLNNCEDLVIPALTNAAIKRLDDKKANALVINNGQNEIAEKTPTQNYNSNFINPLNLKSLPDTVSFEHSQRINNLEKLSNQLNTQRPTIEQLQVKTPSANFPIPVIRFHFDERTFFDSGSSTIRPDSNKIIDMLAEQMKQDMPDTSLVILGHTDSVGSDEYNNDLSINRSASVMQQLAQRGVNLKQMSTVGIGETQPIATNATEDGRSQNRRVEFVLSRFEEANYVAIEQFPRNTEWLNNHPEKQVELEPIIQEKLPVKTKQVVHVQPKATPVVHHNTEAKKLIVFKPTKEMLAPSNPEKITPPEPITMLKESTRTVTIIPAEIVHIIPSTQN